MPVIPALKLVSIILVVATVIPSVAHALELPGKLRLTREQYLAVQTIYYPGFTAIGAAEPLSIFALAALLVLTPAGTTTFWLVAASLLAAVIPCGALGRSEKCQVRVSRETPYCAICRDTAMVFAKIGIAPAFPI